jgi:D-serine deaminase-like pyridoxal phosphate-dependent protein
MSIQTIDDLPTPALILDRAILNRNLKRMSDRLRAAGVMLRPHLKTAKSLEIGRRAVEGHDGRITVSTLAEARYFADGGFEDILYGVGVVPAKLPAISTTPASQGKRIKRWLFMFCVLLPASRHRSID